jgi:hypothetical protein
MEFDVISGSEMTVCFLISLGAIILVLERGTSTTKLGDSLRDILQSLDRPSRTLPEQSPVGADPAQALGGDQDQAASPATWIDADEALRQVARLRLAVVGSKAVAIVAIAFLFTALLFASREFPAVEGAPGLLPKTAAGIGSDSRQVDLSPANCLVTGPANIAATTREGSGNELRASMCPNEP